MAGPDACEKLSRTCLCRYKPFVACEAPLWGVPSRKSTHSGRAASLAWNGNPRGRGRSDAKIRTTGCNSGDWRTQFREQTRKLRHCVQGLPMAGAATCADVFVFGFRAGAGVWNGLRDPGLPNNAQAKGFDRAPCLWRSEPAL